MLVIAVVRGWYQEEGKATIEISPGTDILSPTNVKHWHGAQNDRWLSHSAIDIEGEGHLRRMA